MNKIFRQCWQSPVGPIYLYANADHLLALTFDGNDQLTKKRLDLEGAEDGDALPIQMTITQLKEYFAGQRKVFDLPLLLKGTEFQQLAWRALTNIPYGSCESYTSQAQAMGKTGAVRAVGAANGKNPYSIILPCHRVIGKNGRLTGYAGGEPVKEALLKLEGYLP